MQPDGNEQECADFLEGLLKKQGFKTAQYCFDEKRPTLVAVLEGTGEKPPICFGGHIDTVPLGETNWEHDPFGEIDGDKLYGRGATDMKSGIAAAVSAAVSMIEVKERKGDIKLICTAGEEFGCKGSLHVAGIPETIGAAGALVVPEPTSNRPVCCHRGALWVRVSVKGKTAHGALPHLGDNAIYKAVDIITCVKDLDFNVSAHPMLGIPTVNIGMIKGGQNINSVPDHASFTMDIRTVPGQSHTGILSLIRETAGQEILIETLTDLAPVETDPEHPWMQNVKGIAERILKVDLQFESKQVFTDAAALTPGFDNCPTLILGPGEQGMCHVTDEYCLISRIEQAVEIYTQIMKEWVQ
jgi:succinyl-diaminopimelate desuccinylase